MKSSENDPDGRVCRGHLLLVVSCRNKRPRCHGLPVSDPFLEDFVFAIIRSGGKQYRVAEGERLFVERDILGNADKDKITFNDVLMIGGDKPKVGSPTVSGASVVATIVRESRGSKIVVFRKKHRKNHTKRKHGHRQEMVEVRIDSIKG